jgi:hypothetical protein
MNYQNVISWVFPIVTTITLAGVAIYTLKERKKRQIMNEEFDSYSYYYGLEGWPQTRPRHAKIYINGELGEYINCAYSKIIKNDKDNYTYVFPYGARATIINKNIADNICIYYNNLSSSEQDKYGQFYLVSEGNDSAIYIILQKTKGINIYSIENNDINYLPK